MSLTNYPPMVALTDYSKYAHKSIFTVLFIGAAVAAFGLTFHFYGYSEMVPGPSRQFGFWALAPIGVIDWVYKLFTGARLFWQPVPMFLVLWGAYFGLSSLLAYLFWFKRPRFLL